ncbi:MAG: asparagine synthase (glutamine-hydrolyzing) [Alphaproteobacteria bacterium]|nr:asparagine synthase (glutamine-hydrolyzing) [Alphaproteobacteria bacterium]
MCGFAALFEQGRTFEPELLSAIDKDIYHRGPDSGGQVSETGCGLVFRRLSILDPKESSDQPMTDATGRYTIVFNGEIYNYRALREELKAKGVNFLSDGDTEAILQGYISWGEEILNKLEGMFAFAIWDRKEKKAIIARDPLGIKPLYVARKGNLTAFASEMRPLRRLVGTKVDTTAMSELLMFGYAAGRLSNLKGIEEFPAGTVATVNMETYSERVYCDFLNDFKSVEMTEKEALEMIEEEFTKSLTAHLQSDVGYAVQLSGGVDSSLVTALTCERTNTKPRTFGVNLGDLPMDESKYRDMVMKRYDIDHHEISFSYEDYADAFPKTAYHMEGPIAHSGCPMLMLLSHEIAKTDKVVLTGEGADELFGGYDRYRVWERQHLKGRVAAACPDFLFLLPFFRRYSELRRYTRWDSAIVSSIYYDFRKAHKLFPELIPNVGHRGKVAKRFKDFRDRMMAVDQTGYLGSLLMRQDKLGMSASVEVRVPFTHYPLFKAVNKIPRDIRIPGGITKPLLKKISEKWLPKELLYRRKIGLTLPLDEWLKDEKGIGRYLNDLTAPDCRLAEFTDGAKISNMVEDFRKGNSENSALLIKLVNIEVWLRTL